jgi:hypothetical protein
LNITVFFEVEETVIMILVNLSVTANIYAFFPGLLRKRKFFSCGFTFFHRTQHKNRAARKGCPAGRIAETITCSAGSEPALLPGGREYQSLSLLL